MMSKRSIRFSPFAVKYAYRRFSRAAIPSKPPSPLGLTPSTTPTSRLFPPASSSRIRALSRSLTSGVSPWNAIDQGASKPSATVSGSPKAAAGADRVVVLACGPGPSGSSLPQAVRKAERSTAAPSLGSVVVSWARSRVQAVFAPTVARNRPHRESLRVPPTTGTPSQATGVMPWTGAPRHARRQQKEN